MDEIINVPLHWTNRRLDDRRGIVIKEPDRDGDYRIHLGIYSSYCTHADLLAIHTALGRALGIVSVPMEATEAMVEAGFDALVSAPRPFGARE